MIIYLPANFYQYLIDNELETKDLELSDLSIAFMIDNANLYYYSNSDSINFDFELYTKEGIVLGEFSLELKAVINQTLQLDDKFVDIPSDKTMWEFFTGLTKVEIHPNKLIITGIHHDNKIQKAIWSFDFVAVNLDWEPQITLQTWQFLKTLSPSEIPLFNMLCDFMDDEMLMNIAQADYGYEADYCFSALKTIIKSKKMLDKTEFQVKEVLSLTSFSRSKTQKDHLIRAFSCSCLLIGNIIDKDFDFGGNNENSYIQLVESITMLDKKFHQPAIQFLTWYVVKQSYKSEYQIFTLLLLMLFSKNPEQAVEPILQWFSMIERIEYSPSGEIKSRLHNFLSCCIPIEFTINCLKNFTKEAIKNLESFEDHVLKQKILSVVSYFKL